MSSDTAAVEGTSASGKRHQVDRHPRLLDNVRDVIRCKHYSRQVLLQLES